MTTYADFLDSKRQLDGGDGPEPVWMPEFLFGFQADLTTWALRQSRGGIFADCGLGKTPMQLVWAENIHRITNRPVLIVTPLAVSFQTEREAARFGITAAVSRDGQAAGPITITNYERLERFDPADFAGVVCDESSAIKAFDGVRRKIVTEFLRRMPYRLLCTATAAPNDYIELGTSSEALGYLGHTDMLNRFFVNDQHTSSPVRGWAGGGWRLKGHAAEPFWRWVASWARALRRPSDAGWSDDGFDLPPLHEQQHIISSRVGVPGQLFALPAVGLHEERAEARRTVVERCDKAAELVDEETSAVVWCQLNAESDRATKIIPDAVQVAGADDADTKEAKLAAFSRGDVRVLVTKPTIGAWGLNWQHCHRMTFFPSHSYEQYYQAVRRCWRYGQTNPVTVDVVATEGGEAALKNLQRKSEQASRMFDELVTYMRQGQHIRRDTDYPAPVEVPEWL